MEKEQLIIKRDQLVAELDQFKHENELTVARLERQKEALDQRLQQLEKGAPVRLSPFACDFISTWVIPKVSGLIVCKMQIN